jgi:DNA-binding SARP family transcriptional activator/tetratricopeptide (TPR) repeat protein
LFPSWQAQVRFQLLGEVRAWAGETPVDLGVRKQRFVLAVLALEVNRPVPADRLIDLLWPIAPPASARGMIHTYVSKLRTALNRHDAAAAGVSLGGGPGGYELRCDAEQVDVHRFRDLVRLARHHDDDRQRVALLDRALGLWHGPALSGVGDTDVVASLCQPLHEARLAALEDRFDALLRLGRHREVLDDLGALSAEHPLRQRLTGQLMLALHRTARTAEALDVYDRARRRLADESGLDPAAELRELHQAILRDEPAVRTTPARPTQLPADLPAFTGRAAELDELLATALGTDRDTNRDADPDTATAVLATIDGMAGVGKTAFATHAGHRLAPHFPDGQLFIDLHGYTHNVTPVEPADALDRLLRTLGVPGEQIPPHLDDRAALWRTTLTGRRMLVLLDNAADEDQVRPLLPGAGASLVLVTSRATLSGLDPACPLTLDILPTADARTLFTSTAGTARLDGQPLEPVEQIVELCGRLPLALRIAGARLRARPGWTTTHLAERLRDRRQRLRELDPGQRGVTAAIDLSYQHLTAGQQRLYRLLGLHPGADLDIHAAAALAGSDLSQAEQVLDELVDAHLLAEPTPRRYRFHDLLRAHAAQIATGEPERRAALTRLLDLYTHAATIAASTLYPRETDHRPDPPRPSTPAPELGSQERASAWLDTELINLLGAATHAATHDWPANAVRLSSALHRHLRTRAHYAHAQALHTLAHTAARTIGDRAGEVDALNGLGVIHRIQNRHADATGHHTQAVDIARTIGDRAGEVDALNGLGVIHRSQGRYADAIALHTQAVDIARDTGDRGGELAALTPLGTAFWASGKNTDATACFEQALRIARDIGDPVGVMHALQGLGNTHRTQERYAAAVDYYQQCLGVAETIGDRTGMLCAFTCLGHIHRRQGRHRSALDYYQRDLELARAIGNVNWEFEALYGLGHLDRAAGHPDRALAQHTQALELAHDLEQPDDQARAHDGIAHAHHALGQPTQAREHWERALGILTDLGLTDIEEVHTDDIRAHLAELDHGSLP